MNIFKTWWFWTIVILLLITIGSIMYAKGFKIGSLTVGGNKSQSLLQST